MKLKLCPFCGGEAKLEGVGDDGLSYHVAESWVECIECEAQTETFFNSKYDYESSEECRKKAVNAWNKRTSSREARKRAVLNYDFDS